jgi:hypothetical protein
VLIASDAAEGLNGTIDLNGVRVFPQTDGHPLPDTIRVLARSTNSLKVWMAGKPGSQLRIVVTVPTPALPPETRTLSLIYGSDVAGSGPAGEISYAVGSSVHYRFAANTGFERLVVVVDGRVVADSGTITMDRAHWIVATADTAITLDATEQSLAQSLRSFLLGDSPRDGWSTFQAALDRADAAWGDQAGIHFARVQRVAIDPVRDLPNLVRVDSALSGMVTSLGSPPVSAGALAARAARAPITTAPARARNLEAVTGDREITEIFLVNGIFNSLDDLGRNAQRLNRMLRADPSRFPAGSVFLSSFYSSSLFTSDVWHRIALVCEQAVLSEVYARAGRTLGVTGASEVRGAGARFVACLAAGGIHESDLSVLWRYAHEAAWNAPVNESEVQVLADSIRSRLDVLHHHVFVVGHSRGSLQTQLAVQRLKTVFGYSEESAPRCIGTISVAGVGTANWPLSARHSRFVVAKHDLVTMLDGVARNTRETIEDDDTRAVDQFLGEIIPDSSASQLSTMSLLLYPFTIHALDRYLRSEQSGPMILNYLNDLYQTCAIGQVTVTPTTATLQLGGASEFAASWRALDGQALSTADSVQWSIESTLASVSPSGRVVAGGAAGSVALQAKVRKSVGTAQITIVDDSVRALYTPPVVSVSLRTEVGYVWPGPGGIGLPPVQSDVTWMTISATAMSGASITSAVIFRKNADGVDFSYEVPVNQEFSYFQCNVYIGGDLVPSTINLPTPPYRLVITDSHGLVTEVTGPTP